MSRSSVRHYLGELHRFFKWLHRSPRFGWQVPENFESISRTIPRDTDKVKQSIREVSTFQLEELRLLNRFATPQERLYLLLALNCGFGAKEIATLTIGEVLLHQALSEREQELFSFPSSSADSFVSVVRSKTTIPGKYILFPQTVQMLEWSMSRRLTQPNPTADEPLILNSKGRRLDARTIAGNASQQIPNSFARLKKRVSQNGGHISNLPFKCLRKTAGDLIRRFSDGEISGVFLMHGQPVDSDHLSDVYTHRPFGKVFRSIQRVQKFLEPVFEDVAGDPTDDQGNGGKTRIARKAVAELRIQGLSVREISEITGRSKTSVHRDIQRLTDQADVK